MSEYTTDNLGLKKPAIGSSPWGEDINENWETLDSTLTALKGAAPSTLDTLGKLATAIDNDPDFATTVTNMVAQKAAQSDLDTHIGSGGTAHMEASTSASGFLPQLPGDSTKLFDGSGSWSDVPDTTALETYQKSMNKAMSYPNIILNGEFAVDQDEKGAVSNSITDTYVTDGVKIRGSAVAFTAESTISDHSDFNKCIKYTVTAEQTIDTSGYFYAEHPIEAIRVAALNYASSNAKSAMLTFHVKSSETGTFGGVLRNYISGTLRFYPFTYTVSDPDTWIRVDIVIPGDTFGTWSVDDSTYGMGLVFSLGMETLYSTTAGSWVDGNFYSVTGVDDHISTLGATLAITGIQMYPIDDVANPVVRPYQHDAERDKRECQRYYQEIELTARVTENGIKDMGSSNIYGFAVLPVEMRTNAFSGSFLDTPDVYNFTYGATLTPLTTSVDGLSANTARLVVGVPGGNAGDSMGIYNCTIATNARL